MGLTRREMLRGGVGLGAAALSGATGLATIAGCAKAVPGTPRAAAARSVPARTSSPRPPAPQRLRVAVVKGDQHVVTVLRAVLDKAGVKDFDTIQTEFDVLLPSMLAKRADLAGVLFPQPGSCGNLRWSAPEYVSLTALAVPPGNPKRLNTLADVRARNATVAVMRDLPEHKYLTRIGMPARQVQALTGPVEMLDAVSKGRADCAAFADVALRSLVKSGLAKLDVTTGFALDGEPVQAGAFVFQRDAALAEVAAAFDAGLRQLQDSGEWLRLAEPYGFTKENVPPADLTADKLCTG